MADAGRRVLLIAGRFGPTEGATVDGLAGRLAGRGWSAELVCVSRRDADRGRTPTFEAPGLADRWRRPWAVRGLLGGDGPRRPNLIHVLDAKLGPAGLALAEQMRAPYVITAADHLPSGEVLRISRRYCRAVVATSPALAEELTRGLRMPRGMVVTVPPGLLATDPVGRSRDAGRVPVIGTACALVPGSGAVTFLDAARRIVASGTDAEFIIAGDGPSEAELRRVAERLGVSGRLTFAPTPDDSSPFWRVLDLFCLPALRPTAGLGLALALAHGLPSIASDLPGPRTWLDDGSCGSLVPPGDPEALASAILQLLADPDAARDFGRRGHDRIAADFHPDLEADRLAALYDRIMTGDRAADPLGTRALAATLRS